jgi:hypothetical protein
VDLEVEVHNLEENADALEIERLTLLQNIAEMQQQVEEVTVQVAALRDIVALQPLLLVQAPRGAAGRVWSGPDESGGTTVTDPTSFTCW